MSEYKKLILWLLYSLILFHLFLAAWHVLQGTILFHTDIARDFLLFEDIYYNKNITLIGPRSGGISGVFHGPLWLYLNLPAYILGSGNPVMVGWFWVLLFAVSIYVVYFVSKKLFTPTVGLLTAVLYSSVAASSVHALFNPFGAVITFPVFYYFFYRYLEKKRIVDLAISIFAIGFTIQFQMAFGVPILALITPYILFIAFKKKDFRPALTLLLLAIPLSSFILFDIRHDFLQIKSVISYLSGETIVPDKFNIPFYVLLYKRAIGMFDGALGMLTYNKLWLTIPLVLTMAFVWKKRATSEYKRHMILFLYLFVGYWVLTLVFKGEIWGYYYWPFIGVIAILLSSVITRLKGRMFYFYIGLLVIVYLNNLIITWRSTVAADFSTKNGSLWSFYARAANTVFENAPAEFGYYIYTNDQYGYSTRYAMNYWDRKDDNKIAFPFGKKPATYLMIDDPGDHPITNHQDWRKYDVRIEKQPDWKKRFNKTYFIEKYTLTPEEISVSSNPNLIQDLIFR